MYWKETHKRDLTFHQEHPNIRCVHWKEAHKRDLNSRGQYTCKETYKIQKRRVYLKRVQHTRSTKEVHARAQNSRGQYICTNKYEIQKRLIYLKRDVQKRHTNETYKRGDLQKRSIKETWPQETYILVKRRMIFKRDVCNPKETSELRSHQQYQKEKCAYQKEAHNKTWAQVFGTNKETYLKRCLFCTYLRRDVHYWKETYIILILDLQKRPTRQTYKKGPKHQERDLRKRPTRETYERDQYTIE